MNGDQTLPSISEIYQQLVNLQHLMQQQAHLVQQQSALLQKQKIIISDLEKTAQTSIETSPFFMSYGYIQSPKSNSLSEDYSIGAPAEREQLVVNKIKENHEFAQTVTADAQHCQERNVYEHREESITYQSDSLHAGHPITKAYRDSPYLFELDMPGRIQNKFYTSLPIPANNDLLPSQKSENIKSLYLLVGSGQIKCGIVEILNSRNKIVWRKKVIEVMVKRTNYAKPMWLTEKYFYDTSTIKIFKKKRKRIIKKIS